MSSSQSKYLQIRLGVQPGQQLHKELKTNMLKKYGMVGLAVAMGMSAGLTSVQAEEAEPDILKAPDYRPFTLSLEAGTTGLGGSAHWRFLPHLGIGAGVTGISASLLEVEGDDITFDSDLQLLVAPITVDFYPFKKRSFRISAGIAYNGNEVGGDARFTEDQMIGDNLYTPGQLGTLRMDVNLGNQFVPYVGIGGVMFYFDSAHRWSLGWELGVLFTGSPDVSLRSSNSNPELDADLELERQSIEADLDLFKIYPVAKIAVSFSF